MAKNDSEKALEYALKSNNQSMALADITALYWINGNKDSALKYYNELMDAIPDFSFEGYKRELGVWSLAAESSSQLLPAFQKVIEAAKGN